MHVLDVTVSLNSYITEETTDCISLISITVFNNFMTMASQNGSIYMYIYTHTYIHFAQCQEDSMNNSNGGFSVNATCALQPHRKRVLPTNITQL
jgi:hypothetical protein